jgi:hypothetical protein
VYYPDLSLYTYSAEASDYNVALNIGWLDDKHDFPKGDIPPLALDILLWLCVERRVNPCRGYEDSPFLASQEYGYLVSFHGKMVRLGSAEIRVHGLNGKVYSAPNLIYHYVKDCKYHPPKEFVDAVLLLTAEYEKYKQSSARSLTSK